MMNMSKAQVPWPGLQTSEPLRVQGQKRPCAPDATKNAEDRSIPQVYGWHNAKNCSRPPGRGSWTRRHVETHIPDWPGQAPLPTRGNGRRISEITCSKSWAGLVGRDASRVIGTSMGILKSKPQSYEKAGRSANWEYWQEAVKAGFVLKVK